MKSASALMSERRLNMPETIENMFNVLFNDESWSWSGLATVLTEKYSKSDIEELISCLQIELQEKE